MKIIRVDLEYVGDVRIPRGEYSANDPRLHGKADFLLNAGHAVVIGEMEDIPAPPVTKTETPPKAPAKPTKPTTRKRRS